MAGGVFIFSLVSATGGTLELGIGEEAGFPPEYTGGFSVGKESAGASVFVGTVLFAGSDLLELLGGVTAS